MANDMSNPMSDFMLDPAGVASMGALAMTETEKFWKAQSDILSEMENYMTGWVARRQTALTTAMEAASDMMGATSDPLAPVHAMAEWQRHSAERLTEDMRLFNDLMASCSSLMMATARDIEGDTLEEADKQVKKRTRKKGHATPV